MATIKVKANVVPGMILKRISPQNTVTDIITITAIGAEGMLALDTEAKEHFIYDGKIADYECMGYITNSRDTSEYKMIMQSSGFQEFVDLIVRKFKIMESKNGN